MAACCHHDTRYCSHCDLLAGLDGLHVTAAEFDNDVGMLTVRVESPWTPMGCPTCGVVAGSHGRRDVTMVDAPCFDRPVRLIWRKRTWRCEESVCPTKVVTEQDPDVAAPRALLTTRACWWAINQIRREHASISGIARQLGTTWNTVWTSTQPLLVAMADDETRFGGVKRLGVDEHVWHHVSEFPVEDGGRGPKQLTGMVDLTPDEDGKPRARLLDLVPGRSGKAYSDWLEERGEDFRDGVEVATLDPFHGYKNAVELTDRQRARLDRAIAFDERHDEVCVAWLCAQELRATCKAKRAVEGQRIAEKVLASLPTCPIPEIKRLGKTLQQWKDAFLAYFDTGRANNGGTEAINGLIELHRRIARGFRNRGHYRLRMLVIGGGLTHSHLR